MIEMDLIRVVYADKGTFGVMIQGNTPFAVTLERPWLNNMPMESCIPEGTYHCVRVNSPKFGDTFEVKAVSGRSAILFHKGNVSTDSKGCILVGEQYHRLNGVPSIAASKEGFEEFLRILKFENEFSIHIRGVK